MISAPKTGICKIKPIFTYWKKRKRQLIGLTKPGMNW